MVVTDPTALRPLSLLDYRRLGYRKQERLGSGTYGIVHKCERISDKILVAIKESTARNAAIVSEEVYLLKGLGRHPNIVELLSGSLHPRLIELELLDYTLRAYMELHSPAEGNRVQNMMHQIVNGLAFIHGRAIIHQDLKPENMLIDTKRDRLKIADFGLARRWTYSGSSAIVCTSPYRPLDVQYMLRPHSYDVDLWAAGCIFAELTQSGRQLFKIKGIEDLGVIIMTTLGMTEAACKFLGHAFSSRDYIRPLTYDQITTWDTILPRTPATAKRLFLALVQFCPLKRISAKKALHHAYFSDDPNVEPPTPASASPVVPAPSNDDPFQMPVKARDDKSYPAEDATAPVLHRSPPNQLVRDSTQGSLYFTPVRSVDLDMGAPTPTTLVHIMTPLPNNDAFQLPNADRAASSFPYTMPPSTFVPGQRWTRSRTAAVIRGYRQA